VTINDATMNDPTLIEAGRDKNRSILPAPNLDDRQFQDFVDDAKRMVQRRWPEWTGWTDHNVSDPGVTLIETFAYMADQLTYRLNRVPERNYVKFLELIGVRLQPPTASAAPVTFWLSAPQPLTVTVPAGTEVATERTDQIEAVVFRTVEDLPITPVSLVAFGAASAGAEVVDHTDRLMSGDTVAMFSPQPQPGDCVYIGLSDPAPSNAVALRFAGEVQGYGINPDRPPRRWEAWTTRGWELCEVERDDTGGFNRAGDVVLHLPAGHASSAFGGRQAGWLRCLITEPLPGESGYRATPQVNRLEVFTVGGTATAVHALDVHGEVLGISDGSPGQRFRLEHAPVVLADQPEILQVLVDASRGDVDVVEEWTRIETFADRGADDRCFMLDPTSGTVILAPAVRQPDGSVRQFGAVPARGSLIRIAAYRSGGGRSGNVATRTIVHLKSAIASVTSCENRRPAVGGVDGETVEEAKVRGPLTLRTRDRAVTARDYEHLAREGAPELARVRCLDASPTEPGVVRVLIVPHVIDSPDGPGRFGLEQLRPSDSTLERVRDYLDERRTVGARVVIEPPVYLGVTVVARLNARRRAHVADVERSALDALYEFVHPTVGGAAGEGWPFGRPLLPGDLHAILARVPGVDVVDDVLLFTVDLASGKRAQKPLARIEVPPNGLVVSVGHQVKVEQ
jgi:predicted phage baseplate assembly protein